MAKTAVAKKSKENHKASKKPKDVTISPQRIHDLLIEAKAARNVSLAFKDGRNINGAVIFNEFKGTGRVINIEKEISIDFNLHDLEDVLY